MNKKNQKKILIGMVISIMLILILFASGTFKIPFAIGGFTTLSLDNVQIGDNNRIRIFGTAQGAENILIQFSESQLDSQLKSQGYDATKPITGVIRLEEQTMRFPISKKYDEPYKNLNLQNRGRFSICSIQNCQNELNSGLTAIRNFRTPTLICYCLYEEQEGINSEFTGAELIDYKVSVEINNEIGTLTRDVNTLSLAGGKAKVEGLGFLSNFDKISPPPYSILFGVSKFEKLIYKTSFSQQVTNMNSFEDCINVNRGSIGLLPNPLDIILSLTITEAQLQNCVNLYRNTESQILIDKTNSYKNSISQFANPEDIYFNQDSLVVNLKTPAGFPTFIIDLDATWAGIQELKGEPKILNCPKNIRIKSGDSETLSLNIQNTGNQDGSFYGSVTCSGEVYGTIQETFFRAGEIKDIRPTITGLNTISGIKASTCTYTIRDRKSDRSDSCTNVVEVEFQSGVICSPGSFSCDGNNLMKCSNDGSRKDLYKECELGCKDNKCIEDPEPEEPTCDSCQEFALSKLSFGLISACEPGFFQTVTTCAFSFVRLLLIPVVFIFVLLFGKGMFSGIKVLRNNPAFAWIIAIVTALFLAYLTFVFFWIGVIIALFLIIIRILIRVFLGV